VKPHVFHVPSRSFTWNLKIKKSLEKEIPNLETHHFQVPFVQLGGAYFLPFFSGLPPLSLRPPWGFPHGGAAGVVATSAVSEPEAEEAASWRIAENFPWKKTSFSMGEKMI